MNFPTVFSFDGNKASFSPIVQYNWTAQVKIREYESILTLYGIQSENPFTIHKQINISSIPICKSNLQKTIRRQDTDRAIRTAFAMYSCDPNEVLRRIPIIMIEDCLLYPEGLTKLVWWMTATSKGYKMSQKEVENMLGIIATMCESKKYEVCKLKDDLPKKDYKLISESQRTFLWCLELRKIYGGMNCDKKMINHHIQLWYNRFIDKKNSWYRILCDQNEYEIDINSVDNISKNDLLIESFDHHPYPFIVKKISEKFENISEYNIKNAIWDCSSRINFRTPIDISIYPTSSDTQKTYELIKKELIGFTTWLKSNIDL